MSDVSIDPYQVLGLQRQFTWEELKAAYRRVSLTVHPDKGGNQELFNLVTDCFRQLAAELKARQSDRPHYELKKESQQYYQQQDLGMGMGQRDLIPQPSRFPPSSGTGTGTGTVAREASTGNFQDRFNKMFEDNRFIQEDVERGYGSMMQPSSGVREDINIPRTMQAFNHERFHQSFETSVPAPTKEMVRYKEPEPLPLAKKLAFTELGGVTNDYTGSTKNDNEKKGLQYTDFMRAHTQQRLVDPKAVKPRKEYRTVEEYDLSRSEISASPMTEEELRYQEKKKRRDERAEQERLRRLREYDQKIALHHQAVSSRSIR